MNKFNNKIIVGIVIITVLIIIIYINFLKQDNSYTELESITQENKENIQLENVIKGEKNNECNNEISNDISKKVVVYITGAINNTGIYEMKENSRIADVIEKAGGIKENADIEKINLAYIIRDGMKIYIPEKNEKTDKIIDNTELYVTSNDNGAYEENKEKLKKVNINTATQTELETLPGIGPSTAMNIIEYRKKNGKFNSIDKIKEISGIGNNKFEKIKEFITV